ncbi:hypothetical protein [Mesorhizobium loti]|uniref:hypothetical protein n=1 Tax=Rhizobium loti TaxID=381 RepID=UPI000A77ED9A|nr:hypothetical protein [Mesorhizobium loti]
MGGEPWQRSPAMNRCRLGNGAAGAWFHFVDEHQAMRLEPNRLALLTPPLPPADVERHDGQQHLFER